MRVDTQIVAKARTSQEEERGVMTKTEVDLSVMSPQRVIKVTILQIKIVRCLTKDPQETI